jgi:hypothetical protein
VAGGCDVTAVIGAGPYGMSIGAHLRCLGLPVAMFGRPMRTWHHMPVGTLLQSGWAASSLSSSGGRFSLDDYAAESGFKPFEPIPLSLFIRYGSWFRARAAPPIDTTPVTCLTACREGGFVLELADGRILAAGRVVVATGLSLFAHVPEFAAWLPPSLATHTGQHRNFGSLAGADVAVVGAGQSALEAAALLHEAGATVEVIARGQIRWGVDTLPGRLSGHPIAMGSLPEGLRRSLRAGWLRPSGTTWLRPRVDGVVRLTPGTRVVSAAESGGGLRLALSDGSRRRVDHLLLGTGYRPDVRGLPFLGGALRDRIAASARLPRLNRWFESPVPGLHFVGPLAEHQFGPICRFVAGVAVTARQVAARAAARA